MVHGEVLGTAGHRHRLVVTTHTLHLHIGVERPPVVVVAVEAILQGEDTRHSHSHTINCILLLLLMHMEARRVRMGIHHQHQRKAGHHKHRQALHLRMVGIQAFKVLGLLSLLLLRWDWHLQELWLLRFLRFLRLLWLLHWG